MSSTHTIRIEGKGGKEAVRLIKDALLLHDLAGYAHNQPLAYLAAAVDYLVFDGDRVGAAKEMAHFRAASMVHNTLAMIDRIEFATEEDDDSDTA